MYYKIWIKKKKKSCKNTKENSQIATLIFLNKCYQIKFLTKLK
jgi:hypothetical protein